MSEIELKLAVELQDLPRAWTVLLSGHGRSPSQSLLTSVYYDTPDFDLSQRDLTLRVRQDGERFVQTIKMNDLTNGDLLQRGEWEDEIRSKEPEPSAPRSGERLPRKLKPSDLRPVFCTVVRRSSLTIEPRPKTDVEVAAQGRCR
jgi:triphosphatase